MPICPLLVLELSSNQIFQYTRCISPKRVWYAPFRIIAPRQHRSF